MPGAGLDEIVDENRWKATMHVKLGPIALQFRTDIVREEADESARRVVLSVNAREARGRGAAQARIESSLSQAEDETAVAIVTDLNLQGTVAQYGRGVVADVSSELTRQFAECIAEKLTAGEPAAEEHAREAGGPAAPVAPIGGLRLGLGALWRALLGRFRRSPRTSSRTGSR